MSHSSNSGDSSNSCDGCYSCHDWIKINYLKKCCCCDQFLCSKCYPFHEHDDCIHIIDNKEDMIDMINDLIEDFDLNKLKKIYTLIKDL